MADTEPDNIRCQPKLTVALARCAVAACGMFFFPTVHGADVIERSDDWTVDGEETIVGKHIRINGTIVLPPGSKLTLEDCTLEITGEYSREHSIEWNGGTLITKNCKVGGYVNDSGTAIHTVFHLYKGLWEATDTIVSYSYGISFHWEKGKGILRGKTRRDYLSGEADVELVDSDFPIGLGIYCNKGGSTELRLMPSDSVTSIFDRTSLLPGVNWRLELKNTRVERWFLFLRRIGQWQPPAVVSLGESRDVIVSFFSHNLAGTVTLTDELVQPLRIGNLILRRSGDHPSGRHVPQRPAVTERRDGATRWRTYQCTLLGITH